MLLSNLYNALIEDYRQFEMNKEIHSEAFYGQLMDRILKARKGYPEYFQDQKPMLPQLNQVGQLDGLVRQSVCLDYWTSNSNELHADQTVEGVTDAEILDFSPELDTETASTLLHEKLKVRLLHRYIKQASDSILMNNLNEMAQPKPVSQDTKATQQNETTNKQAIVIGLRYHLHLLQAHLADLIKVKQERLMREASAEDADANQESSIDTANGMYMDEKFSNVIPLRPTKLAAVFDLTPASTAYGETVQPDSLTQEPPDFDPISLFDASNSDEPLDIWYALAENPQTPYRFLVWLSENHNPYVSKRAGATLSKMYANGKSGCSV
jgi:hypothetical protein